MGAQLRLFVAAYPPDEVAGRLSSLLGALDLARHRRTPAEQIHLTLQFIGPTSTRELPDVQESVSRSVAGLGPFELTVQRLITLPRGKRPRLVAAQLDAPAPLLEIQRRLATRLARHARQSPGDRFLPHMTLCRFVQAEGAGVVDHPIQALIRFEVSEIHLMKSVLRPQGAEHGVVGSVAL